MYCAIIAGGGGTRLWPKSRRKQPKQLLTLQGDASLFQQAAERVLPLCGIDGLLVVTSQDLAPIMRKLLPDIPPAHIVAEPMPRQTAMAIGLAAIRVDREHPNAVLASVGADHLIADVAGFRRCLEVGVKVAEQGDYLVTIGVQPTAPHIGYGYIKAGEEAARVGETAVYAVDSFKEKPDRETAQSYLDAGGYYWNSNYFVWRVSTLLTAFEQFAPTMYQGLRRLQQALDTPDEERVAQEVFAAAPADPIDTAILEKASNLVVVPGTFDWVDVGNWNDMYAVAQEAGDNHTVGEGQGPVLFEDSRDCLVHRSDRLIALVGVENLVVVDTEDAVLILPRDRDQDVRRIVERLREQGLEEYL
ncbi:MAG TPA: sugar phosphate nucleotidyltransferase [Chloroflexota bacterium]|nr:sugar phosphate nucleotidyltransferase [Chloroflexota bacterium]